MLAAKSAVDAERTQCRVHLPRAQNLMWDDAGMARSDAGLRRALVAIPRLRDEFWTNVRVMARTSRSTNRWNVLVAWPTSWSRLNCCALTRCTAPSRAEPISARRARPKRARRCGMTSALPMSQHGSPSERWRRVRRMVIRHDAQGFGHCSNHGECEAACPKSIPLEVISLLNRDLRNSMFRHSTRLLASQQRPLRTKTRSVAPVRSLAGR